MPLPKFDSVVLLDACYDQSADDHRWASALLQAARPLFDRGRGFGFGLVEERESGPCVRAAEFHGLSSGYSESALAMVSNLDAETFQEFWYPPKPVILASSLLARVPAATGAAVFQMIAQEGGSDVLGALGHPAQGKAFVLFSVLPRGTRVTGRVREGIQRFRVHVETALRLRLSPEIQPLAVLGSDGRVLHAAADDCASGPGRQALRTQVDLVERARVAQQRRGWAEALDTWRALADGRWSVVRRLDADGKCLYFAYENPPHARTYRMLTATEAAVVDFTAKGLTGKHVAYALGLTEATVSDRLKSAALRMGFLRVTDMVRFASRTLRVQPGTSSSSAGLSRSEAEVLEFVHRGYSNRKIAESRGTSEHTVARQISSILRKTGAPNRRVLLGIEASASAEAKDV